MPARSQRRPRTAARHSPSVEPLDRDAARRSLWRLLAPSEIALKLKTEVGLIAVLHYFETLYELAQPIPPALEKHLEPWRRESRQRRLVVIDENRRADEKYRRECEAERSHG